MANYYYGPQTVDTSSYDAFKQQVNGNGYDVNNDAYGAQCVDAMMLINYNLGFPSPYAWAGPNESAYEMWTDTVARAKNAGNVWDLIYNLADVKRGDMVIFDAWAGNPNGHNAFADEDYNGQQYLQCLGQNQFGDPFPTGGACFNVYGITASRFLGAFRLPAWHPTPTPSSYTSNRSRLPLIMLTRRLIGPNSML